MRKTLVLALVACLTMSAAGCTIVKVLARGNKPIILNTPPEHYTVLGHFKESKTVMFDYTGAPDITAMVRDGSAGHPDGDAIVNTFISIENTVTNFFLNLVTLGFANSYTVTVEGDVIKYGE